MQAPSSICIFEDKHFSQLYPLTFTRPVFDLRCGIFSLKNKLIRCFPQSSVHLLCRTYLEKTIQDQNPEATINNLPNESSEHCLFINGRVLANSEFLKKLDLENERIYTHSGTVVAAVLARENRDRLKPKPNEDELINFEAIKKIRKIEVDAKLIKYPWNLVNRNQEQIEFDINCLNESGQIEGNVSKHAILLNRENIRINENSTIKAGAVLDAEAGPIYIGENVTIMSNTAIIGPAFIGKNSIIKIGAKIYAGTSIGESCKVGGEVEDTIFHSFSNKQHDGFIGHSYLGQWINLGADTNNSDLKNNYGTVKVFIDGQVIDSGSQFVGLFMGDHSKSGISTMFNTGTTVGPMSNIYGGGFPPKNILSFVWGGSDGFVQYDLEKALETARIVMARRGVTMTTDYEKMIRKIFELTVAERKSIGTSSSKA